VVVSVANGCELLGAEAALVRPLSGVNSVVYLQVASLVKGLVADDRFARPAIGADYLLAHEHLLAFLGDHTVFGVFGHYTPRVDKSGLYARVFGVVDATLVVSSFLVGDE